MPKRGFWTRKKISDLHHINTLIAAEADFDRRSEILPANYHKAELAECVPQHLTKQQREELLTFLHSFADLFEGKLQQMPGRPYDIQLKSDAKPFFSRPFPVPQIHYKLMRDEVDRLVKLGVLKQITESEWAAPSFGVPKKNHQIRFVSDFRRLNKEIVRHPFPLPSIQDTLRRLEGFTYCTALDLNMGYWTVPLSHDSQRLCTIILPWGIYCYLVLPMGLCTAPDVFQGRMSTIFGDLPFVIIYLDDILVITKGSFHDHLNALQQVMERLRKNNLQVHADKSSFCSLETEYLGFKLTQQGIFPQDNKVRAILDIAPPKTVRQVRSFLGAINHYKQMIQHRSHLSAPLTELTKKGHKFKWTTECQDAFDALKSRLAKQVALSYPDFTKPFEIYTDASKLQLGSVICQQGRPLAFYSRKLTGAQTRYTVIEQELLSIVETLREFRTILLGHEIIIYTDHKNLTFDNFTTDRVRRWRLIVEEYAPTIIYIKGVKNEVADALSRLPITDSPSDESAFIESCFAIDADTFPLAYDTIAEAQQEDETLQDIVDEHPDHYERRIIQQNLLIFRDNKIVVPQVLQSYLIDWYHSTLLHPGIDRLKASIKQHFTWKNLSTDIENHVRNCETCQKFKRQRKHYGKLPLTTHDPHPWQTVCVDLIGPWTVPSPTKIKSKSSNDSKDESLKLLALTAIDPDTSWIEIIHVPNKESETIAQYFDQQWLSRYPRPLECIHDNGSEFVGFEFQELLDSYGIKSRVTTVGNPQANAILERVHQVIANMLRSTKLMQNPIKDASEFTAKLQSIQWAINSTYHTTLRASPAQLVFGRDMILPTTYLANWAAIQHRRQSLSEYDNNRENATRIPHEYRVNDRVLIRRSLDNLGKLARPTLGPFRIVDVSSVSINGTVIIDRGNCQERINIRRLLPFFPRHN